MLVCTLYFSAKLQTSCSLIKSQFFPNKKETEIQYFKQFDRISDIIANYFIIELCLLLVNSSLKGVEYNKHNNMSLPPLK